MKVKVRRQQRRRQEGEGKGERERGKANGVSSRRGRPAETFFGGSGIGGGGNALTEHEWLSDRGKRAPAEAEAAASGVDRMFALEA